MFSVLRAMVASSLAYLHPGAPTAAVIADAIAAEISRTCSEQGALGSCELDAVALAVSAEQEGHLCLGVACARGDHGQSASTFQVKGRTAAETERYERDLGAATHRAYVVLGRHTNALGLAPPCAMITSFGHPESFASHQATAAAASLRTVVLDREGIAFDVDTPADHEHLTKPRQAAGT